MGRSSCTEMGLEELEHLIAEEMPITQHLDFSLATDEEGRVHASAPLQPNTNHMGSAFGGSLSMLATLTGWAMMHQVVEDAVEDMKRRVEVMIQESDIEYMRPVYENISVICERPDDDALDRFEQMMERWGRARLELKCRIDAAGERAVTFIGRYVAMAQGEEKGDGAPAFHSEDPSGAP